ncbi:septum formation family protein [Demequina gelatinilytica]|uniref:septum formation family protein n=1 Tax=Demequina gelatinilytica TaxID=1638980 RepID=UPI0012E04638|nr:septum formation family protein [Demequina gelatinilytica]
MRRRAMAVVGGTAVAASLGGCALLGAEAVEELELAVGECVDESSLSGSDEEEQQVGSLPRVDCAGEHDAEVYYVEDLTDSSLPDDVADRADQICYEQYAGYVGVAFEDSRYYYVSLYPSSSTWAYGDRQIACMLVGEAGERLTGSLKGAAA